jgi:hypothetical protein
MKRTLLAIALAAGAATAFAANDAGNDQYRNGAGQQDQHQPVLGAISGSTLVASAYRSNAGDASTDNVVQTQLG